MIKSYFKKNTTAKFTIELAQRFWFIIVSIFTATFLGAILEIFGISILIPFFSVLSDTPYEAPNELTRYFYSLVFQLRIEQSPSILLLLILILFFGRSFMLWATSSLQNFLSYRLSILLRQSFVLNAYNASWLFLIKQKFGHIQYIMSRDIPQVIDFLSRGIGLLYNTLLLIIYTTFAFLISPFMALIAMGSGLVFVLLLRFVTITIRRYSKKIVEMEKEFAHYMYQLTSGIKVIKSVIPRIIIQKQSDKFATDFTDASLRFSVLYPLGTIFFQPLAALIIFITFFVSYGRPGFSFAVFTVLFYLIYRVISQVQAIQSVLQSLMSYLPHVSSFAFFHYALLQAREEVSKKGKPFMFNKNLRFSNIVFSYADRAPVLKDLSFSIEKGTSVGIIGISGAGKTTIADLLLRLLTPSAGKILIDGTDIKEFNLEDWRHNVGYVSQDPFLLHDSVKNNVKLYDEEISDDRVKKALESAYIKDLMEQLPLGYDTLVGDRGMTLSVGQRQRLILARIFARDPKLIILDEATSALDNESEAMVLNAIDNLRGKTTLLVITHRLSTVMNMGRLLILDSGHIIEEGSPQELLSDKSSYFYKMYHAGHKK